LIKRHKHMQLTEQQFTNQLLEWAKVYGWRRFHVRNSGSNGMTTVQGDRGFPDLVLVRPPRLIFAELKVGKNKPTDEQDQWIAVLQDVGGSGTALYINERGRPADVVYPWLETYVWHPEQWSEILVVLSR
jgi:hypothetical protein